MMFKRWRNPILPQPKKLGQFPSDAKKVDQRSIHLSNWEVAHAMTGQALNHADQQDWENVVSYLKYIELLLQKPEESYEDYSIDIVLDDEFLAPISSIQLSQMKRTTMESQWTEDQKTDFQKELPDGTILVVHVSFDDDCHNGHNTFSITCDHYDRTDYIPGESSLLNSKGKRLFLGSFGCQHDLIKEHFPELAPYLKWHLCSTIGPLHYLPNTLYWAGVGNLDFARNCAIAPEATLEQLASSKWLEDRLPNLLIEFRQAIESLDFTW